jgi:hypothetical protein
MPQRENPTGRRSVKSTKLRLYFANPSHPVDLKYVLDSLFNLTNRKKEVDLSKKAEDILRMAAKGLRAGEWEKNYTQLEITQSQYFYILNVLRDCGLLVKEGKVYYTSRHFTVHLLHISATINSFMDGMGVKR